MKLHIDAQMTHPERYARVIGEANYVVDNDATIRETAEIFGVSKTTVHNDITKALYSYEYNRMLYWNVQAVIEQHIETRAALGGKAANHFGVKKRRRKHVPD